jgi:hypothetical protein
MSRIPPLPALPDRYAKTGDIKDANWVLLSDVRAAVRARDRQIVEACIEVAAQLDCAHRCGVGSELAAALRSLLGEGEGKE